MKSTGDQNVQVLQRALHLMESFTPEQSELSLTDLCRTLGLPKSTVHRLLTTLSNEGYIKQDLESQKYSLSLKVLRFAHVVSGQLRLEKEADSFLRALAAETGGDAHLATLDKSEGDVVYFKTISPVVPLSTVGTRTYIHGSGLGKVLAAYQPNALVDRILATRGMPAFTPRTITDPTQFKEQLETVRACGYAVDDEELKLGWCCVAAPVQDYTGEVTAAISVSGPSYHFTGERLKDLASLLSEKVNAVSRALGCREEHLIRNASPNLAPSQPYVRQEVMLIEN